MLCPKCGYAMMAFDLECPRCKIMAKEELHKDTPTPNTPPVENEPTSLPVNTHKIISNNAPIVKTEEAIKPSTVQQNPSPNDGMLHCAACNSTETISVMQMLKYRSAENQQTIAPMGSDEDTVNLTLDDTLRSAYVATSVRPKLVISWALTILISILGYLICLILSAGILWEGPIAGLMTLLLSVYMVRRDADIIENAITNYRDEELRWEAAMNVWEQMIYCKRCQALTDPLTNDHAATSQIRRLIHNPKHILKLPPADTIALTTKTPDRDKLTVQAFLIGVVVTAFAFTLYSVGNNRRIAYEEQVKEIQSSAVQKAQQSINDADHILNTIRPLPHPETSLNSDLEELKSERDKLSNLVNTTEWTSIPKAKASTVGIDQYSATIRQSIELINDDVKNEPKPENAGKNNTQTQQAEPEPSTGYAYVSPPPGSSGHTQRQNQSGGSPYQLPPLNSQGNTGNPPAAVSPDGSKVLTDQSAINQEIQREMEQAQRAKSNQ